MVTTNLFGAEHEANKLFIFKHNYTYCIHMLRGFSPVELQLHLNSSPGIFSDTEGVLPIRGTVKYIIKQSLI